ncbi:MAG TPA: hydrogenase maturation protease [Gemmataceae bacterium]|nr:hydrogenase maturation protease [Gemmataceae bacterium]
MRVLIAGVGNVLRGDDGFGAEVLRRLEQEISGAAGVRFFESGIAGIGLVQQLLDGFDALIVLDALDRGAEPGTVFVLEPDVKRGAASSRADEGVDLHQTDPEGVFRLAAALGVLPPRVWVVGCQAAACDGLGAGLTEPVRRAVPAAVRRVHDLLARLQTAAG